MLSYNVNGIVKEQKECGADRDRTDDLRLARAALSQLSYSPDRRWLVRARRDGGPR